ncbi:lipopolysaccharide heptosyltransferase I [Hydrogenimonas sp.]|nr:lipopolysaccharide heptosyltransferase I [Hydrogenimonas sp.]
MKVAIVRLTAMGDVIHTLSALQFVKRAQPDTEITWFVESKFAQILENSLDIDNIVPVNLHRFKSSFSLSALKDEVRKVRESGPFDLVIDVQGLVKSAVLARIAGRMVAGLDYDSAKEGVASFLYSERFRVDCSETAPYRFASLIASALKTEITKEMLLKKSPYLIYEETEECEEISGYFEESAKNVLIVTGASNESKTYPPEKFAEVAGRLEGCNVLLVAGSERERESAAKIEESSSARLLPRMSLNGLKYAVSRCDLLIGGDTGPSHMAWAMNRPSLLLFGSTPRSMMMETPVNIALTSGAKVHPCRFDRSDRSITKIDPAEVARTALELLS